MAQHDYVIDNSTGANVRADINNALLAISSNNSGSSAPSTTYALQTFANTTDSMLQLRNSANNAFVNLRKFDGSLPLPDGTNSAPSLFFDDDTNTGLYSSAADTLNIATGGVERLELGTTTIFNEGGEDVDFRIEGNTDVNLFYLDAGNDRIGLSTSSPDQLLHLAAASNGPFIRFQNTDTTVSADQTFGGIEFESSDVSANCAGVIAKIDCISTAAFDGSAANGGELRFHTSGTAPVSVGERMRIDASGNVGIGTSNPTQLLHLSHADPRICLTETSNNSNCFRDYSAGGVLEVSVDDNNVDSASKFQVRIDGATASLTLDGTGLGIGTTSPDNVLDLGSSTQGRALTFASYSNLFSEHSSGALWISSNFFGNAGASGYKTSVTGNFGAAAISVNATGGGSSSGVIEFYTDDNASKTAGDAFTPSETMRINEFGQVGIGTSSPQLAKLHIGPSEFGLNLQNDSNNISKILFTKNSVGNDARAAIHGNGELNGFIKIHAGDNERLRLLADGDAFLGGAAGADRMFQSNSKGFVYDNDTTTDGSVGGNHPFIGIQHAVKTTGAAAYISFQSATTERGKIAESNSGNNVTYNTSSDYRLKQDEVLISDGITRLKLLKPYQFKWKDDLDFGYVDGFFAHEVGEVVKGAATGTKDEVVTQEGLDNGTYKNRSVGDMVVQGLDYSRITPLLTAALQEAITKIEVLETKVAALEAA